MSIRIYQVDAFTDQLFHGNPAAVCPLDEWLADDVLQKIAAENNLSETAFIVKEKNRYHIRWMTPTAEVKLCGHATLATAYVITTFLEPTLKQIIFTSKSGELYVHKEKEMFTLNFPANKPKEIKSSKNLNKIFQKEPSEVLFSGYYVFVYDNENDVIEMQPNYTKLKELDHPVMITAPSEKYDFISRFFAPTLGVNEDPVTGSAHTILGPFWAERLEKNELYAYQASKRGGELFINNLGDRVEISGKAVLYLTGKIRL